MSRPKALVTGASSGIGRALALEFASKGYDIIAVSRDEKSLSTLASECRTLHHAEVKIRIKDLGLPRSLDDLVKEVKENPLDVLVNNAGFGVYGSFAETDLSQEIQMVQVQIHAMMILTKAALPGMLKKNSGKILNVASVYSYAPVPYQSVYGACKAFILSFSDALADEVRGSGIQITTLCPGVTQTEFRKRAGVQEQKVTSGVSAEHVARFGYQALTRGKVVAIPGVVNKLFVHATRILPRSWVSPALRRINQYRGVTPHHR